MTDYLPEINFNRHNKTGHDAGAWSDRQYISQRQYNPENRNSLQILRDAFEKYIHQTPIESNTIGIQIIYLQNRRATSPKTIFLMKRVFDNNTEMKKISQINPDTPQSTEIENGENLNQIEPVINTLRRKKILQISLCEVYNDTPVERTKRGPLRLTRRGRERMVNPYYPFTIPIKLLYRNIPQSFIPERRTPDVYDWEEFDRLADEQRALAQEESLVLASGEQQLRMQEQTPEQREALLEDPFFSPEEEYNRPGELNPNLLTNDPSILNKPITSFVWPGECVICTDNSPKGLCRVNCSVGHIFHCDCLSGFRNTKTMYGWNNKCPVCRQEITAMANVPSDTILPSSFGKSSKFRLEQRKRNGKSSMKKLDSDIAFLLKLK